MQRFAHACIACCSSQMYILGIAPLVVGVSATLDLVLSRLLDALVDVRVI